VRRATQWFLRNADLTSSLAETAERYRAGIDTVSELLETELPDAGRSLLGERRLALRSQDVPEQAARRLAGLSFLARAADVVETAARFGAGLAVATRALYGSAIGLGVDRIIAQADRLTADDFYERLAINRTIDQVFQSHRAITAQILASSKSSADPWIDWSRAWSGRVEQAQKRIHGLLEDKTFGLAKLAVAQGALADLATAPGHSE
jgi:glutamate dehydrogenase